ncbi:hypothetical protein A3Q56_00873 [Intoshia linei]|uniref:Uncharacterized protein n=1 Tax=Intoshia linei TaxID=1819745 RepID=A0A177BCG0_9BILA|nr:hypothetical protein A3Q56_00873 [Intoshia linei]
MPQIGVSNINSESVLIESNILHIDPKNVISPISSQVSNLKSDFKLLQMKSTCSVTEFEYFNQFYQPNSYILNNMNQQFKLKNSDSFKSTSSNDMIVTPNNNEIEPTNMKNNEKITAHPDKSDCNKSKNIKNDSNINNDNNDTLDMTECFDTHTYDMLDKSKDFVNYENSKNCLNESNRVKMYKCHQCFKTFEKSSGLSLITVDIFMIMDLFLDIICKVFDDI